VPVDRWPVRRNRRSPGGGFRHGQHLAFDTRNNHNLATLHVSMLQRLGIEADSFASAKTTMKGLEMA
jgi:hypothetical protein